MLPINFLFLTVWPVVDMRLRCKSNGQDYPPDVPLDITKVLELNMVIIQHTHVSFFVSLSFKLVTRSRHEVDITVLVFVICYVCNGYLWLFR